MTRIGSCLITLLLASTCIAAPSFQAPMKGEEPFRRDRLPIDPDQMSSFSEELTTMAAACSSSPSPNGLRAAAQFLALAHALRPTNRDVSEMVRQLSKDQLPKPPTKEQLSRARSIAWNQAGWLASSEAGTDANLVAACLGDALAVADPNHPNAANLRDRGEQGQWDDWVAPPEAFGVSSQPKPKADTNPGVTPKPGTDSGDTGEDPPQGTVPFKLQTTQVLVPMWVYDQDTRKSDFDIVPLAIKSWSEPMPEKNGDDEEERPRPKATPQYYVGFRSEGLDSALRPTFDPIRVALENRHGGLPMRGRGLLSVPSGGNYTWKSDHDSAGAAIALLMDATITGIAPGTDVIVLGTIDSEGKLKPSWRLWDRLRLIANNDELRGGRLILPREAAPMLEALLALGKPYFFLRYEVLLAGSLSELAERAITPASGDQKIASGEFAQVRTAQKDELIGPYLANRFVRERLGNILKTFPDHASARMALLQGGGERPTRLSTPILAAELRNAIHPMAWISQTHDADDFKVDRIVGTYKTCRDSLNPIEDLVARDDLKLWESTFELVVSIRTFSNTIKRTSRQDLYHTAREEARKAATEMAKRYQELYQELVKLSGEEVDPVKKSGIPKKRDL